MPKITRSAANIVPIPKSVSVASKGYVYLNTSTFWGDKKNSPGKCADHTKVCIGIALHPGKSWSDDRRMYANAKYYELFDPSFDKPKETKKTVYQIVSEYPERADSVSVGLYAVVRKLSEESGLSDAMAEVFGSENSWMILDLAMYMISAESAVFQHYPHWAKSHALFSDEIRSDSYISSFLKEGISLSEINLFRKKWAQTALDDGRVYVCYDSTNVNSQAEGVFIVQKGHAKDDPTLEQVNTEYAIRQRDGLPITFMSYPGSINDMSEAQEMVAFFKGLMDGEDKKIDIGMIADRGYVSEENIKALRDAGIGYIMMLKKNMSVMDEVLEKNLRYVKNPQNYQEKTRKFGLTVRHKLFDSDSIDSWFHIVWSAELEVAHRDRLMEEIGRHEKHLEKASERKTLLTEEELRNYREYFDFECHAAGELEVNQRGRGSGKKKKTTGYVIDRYERNNESIARADMKCGYMVLVSDREMTAAEAMEALSKRDCVEKIFRALKSSMGMDAYGVHFESSMHVKSLIWFVASIIYALIFKDTENIRIKDKKRGTVPALVDQFEEVTADKDLTSGVYQRRYRLTKWQKKAMNAVEVTEKTIDEIIADLT